MAEKTPLAKNELELEIREKPAAQPANHFVVSYAGDDFALDILYVHPHDLHAAKQDPEKRSVPATMVARIAFNYLKALELRKRIDDMVKSYEEHKK